MPSTELPSGVTVRDFYYSEAEWVAWKAVRNRSDPQAWGRFQKQAVTERYLFTHRQGQSHYHFGETLVGAALEGEGYKCWTTARLIRRREVRRYAKQTEVVERLLKRTLKRVPQVEYEKRRTSEGLHLKTIDLVGYHAGRRHWVFCEVKRGNDKLMREQIDTLEFLRGLYPDAQAEVLVARVLPER